ncbi:TadE family type IV pilus minor pilin [Nonomuraea coxensis]|uniref:TadE family type IV pilus minor pilin n=2 Tax=Nonomuraea coxensis TaxID=404386 RepID=UPI0009FBE3CE|nr:TadE family type IV pilus minor pilin [Nonomuraea coxensis]
MTFRPCRLPRGASAERGSVTAETAAVLPALMIVLAAGLWAIQSVAVQLECVDAARSAARAAARGEPVDEVRAVARQATSANAQVDITRDSETTKVQIAVQVRPAWGSAFPPVRVSASAVADTEP